MFYKGMESAGSQDSDSDSDSLLIHDEPQYGKEQTKCREAALHAFQKETTPQRKRDKAQKYLELCRAQLASIKGPVPRPRMAHCKLARERGPLTTENEKRCTHLDMVEDLMDEPVLWDLCETLEEKLRGVIIRHINEEQRAYTGRRLEKTEKLEAGELLPSFLEHPFDIMQLLDVASYLEGLFHRPPLCRFSIDLEDPLNFRSGLRYGHEQAAQAFLQYHYQFRYIGERSADDNRDPERADSIISATTDTTETDADAMCYGIKDPAAEPIISGSGDSEMIAWHEDDLSDLLNTPSRSSDESALGSTPQTMNMFEQTTTTCDARESRGGFLSFFAINSKAPAAGSQASKQYSMRR